MFTKKIAVSFLVSKYNHATRFNYCAKDDKEVDRIRDRILATGNVILSEEITYTYN